MGAYFPELFRVRYRYSGGVVRLQRGGHHRGGISPLVATELLARTGSTTAFSWYLVGVAVLCLVGLLFLEETKDRDFSDGLGARPLDG